MRSEPGANLIGSIVDGKFIVVSWLGQGGFAQVYKAQQMGLNRFVALKLFKREFLRDAETMARFNREGQILCEFQHRNICQFFAFGVWAEVPYIAMEFCEGQNLYRILVSGEKLTPEQTVSYITQCCDALQAAHQQGIVHRDLTPLNIMVKSDGQVKILDFGLAKVTAPIRESQSLTQDGQFLGSPSYASPEQCLGAKIDARSDIYSLGCILFQCLTGRPIYECDDRVGMMYKHINESPPFGLLSQEVASFEPILQKALKKHPEERYQSVEEMATDLKECLNELRSRSDRNHVEPTGRLWDKKKIALICFLTCLAVAGATLAIHYGSNIESDRHIGEQGNLAEEASILLSEARKLVRNNDQSPGKLKYRQAIELLSGAGYSGSPSCEDAETELAAILMQDAHFAEAEPLFRAALSTHHQEDINLQRLTYLAATNYYKLKNYPLAEKYCSQSIALAQKLYGPQSVEVGRLLRASGDACAKIQQFQRARALYEQSLAVLAKTCDPTDPQLALTKAAIGHLNRIDGPALAIESGKEFSRQHKVAAAEAEYRRALSMLEPVKNLERAQYVTTLGLLGSLLRDNGRVSEAAPILSDAVKYGRQLNPDEAVFRWVLFAEACNLGLEKNISRADMRFSEASQLAAKYEKTPSRAQADVLRYWGEALLQNGDVKRGTNKVIEAISLYDKLDGPGNFESIECRKVIDYWSKR